MPMISNNSAAQFQQTNNHQTQDDTKAKIPLHHHHISWSRITTHSLSKTIHKNHHLYILFLITIGLFHNSSIQAATAFITKNSHSNSISTCMKHRHTTPSSPFSSTTKTQLYQNINNLKGIQISNQNEGIILPEDGLGAPCIIKVLGVGGGGGNAVNRMIQTRIEGVSFWAINTDAQALAKSLAPNRLNIGREVTRGLGAGGIPTVGEKAALENVEELKYICNGADMVFITAGMGGGTGSGAAPVVAEIARDLGCLTVGVVTKPFAFEGKRRMQQAEGAIETLRKYVDTLIVVSNDKLLRIVPDNTPVTDAFLVADDILRQGVVGISEIIIKTGLVNVDFADVRAVMKDAGTALMGVGTGVGKTRAADAAVAAISSPLLDFPISEAKRIVFNIVGGPGLGLSEINAASEVIYENAHEDANIIFGALIDDSMGEEVSITVLACDFRQEPKDTNYSSSPKATSTDSWDTAARSTNLKVDAGRDPNFYKERRQATKSPLGPDASLEETRVALTRGFKKPTSSTSSSSSSSSTVDDNSQKGEGRGFRKALTGLFKKFVGR